MKRFSLWIPGVLLLVFLIGACRPEAAPPDASKQVSSAPEAGWEQKWEKIVESAKKEGTVSVYMIWRPQVRTALADAFKAKYGINVEFSAFSRGAEMAAKYQAEKSGGLTTADFFSAGNETHLTNMKPIGLLGSIKPLLILPEVLEPKVWRGGAIPFTDEEGTSLSMIGSVIRNTVYNTDLIKEGEITSYKDLLKPQYKGKITLNDPSVSGGGNFLLTHLGHSLWGEAETRDFLRKLITEQKVVIQRDTRLHMEEVARGKYAIGPGPSSAALAEFLNLGAPIKLALVQEENRMSAAAGAMAVPAKLANPNAATVFVNWLLSKEGQTVFARAFAQPSTRLDAPTEGINPLFIPKASEKYYVETADFFRDGGKWMKIAQEIIAETMK